MASQLEKVFNADPKSVYELFLSKGAVGFYVPAYQRHYSWDDKNINRLIEDICGGISSYMQYDDSITFIGTVISIWDTDYKTIKPYVVGELPSEVMSIIDGQQRLTTLTLLSTCLHQFMTSCYLKFPKLDDVSKGWFSNAFNPVFAKLRQIFELDKYSNDERFRFYPKMTRAYSDQWATSADKAFYNSPIANYLYSYIQHIHAADNCLPKDRFFFNYSDSLREEDIPKYKKIKDNVNSLNKHLKSIISGDEGYNFPTTEDFVNSKDSQRRIIGNEIPDSVRQYIQHEKDLSRLVSESLRLLVLANFFLDRVAVTSVVATNETYAFDMFEALNTTGEPLTAFETFKPKVVDEEGIENYQDSPSRSYIEKIDDTLDKYKKAEEKQKATTRLLIPFSLIHDGEALSKHLSDQRRFINKAFDSLDTIHDKRSFTEELSFLAVFMEKVWPERKTSLSVLDEYCLPDKELIFLCIEVLREANHSITIGLIFRFYSSMVRDKYSKDSQKSFGDVVKAVLAFFVLWRGSRHGTQGIDACYREIMRNGVEGVCPPLKLSMKASFKPVEDVNKVKKALLSFLNSAKTNSINNKIEWIDKASKISAYENSKSLTRFMLLLSSNNTSPSDKHNGMLVSSVSGYKETLTRYYWDKFHSIEHIYPQSPSSKWDESLSDLPSIHTIGNLLLLPQPINSSLSNSGWGKKSAILKVICAKTIDERNSIIESLNDTELSISTSKLILSSDYMPQVEAVSLVEDWTADVVTKRSENICGIIWDQIRPWLS